MQIIGHFYTEILSLMKKIINCEFLKAYVDCSRGDISWLLKTLSKLSKIVGSCSGLFTLHLFTKCPHIRDYIKTHHNLQQSLTFQNLNHILDIMKSAETQLLVFQTQPSAIIEV